MKSFPYFKSPSADDALSVPIPLSSQERPRVLVVEDHEDTRLMLRTMLERRGLSVLEAENGEAAIRLAELERPGLILMDGGLPLLDGLETTRLIRAHEALNRVPIVFLSGHASDSYRRDARNAGCDEFLVKPVDLDQLEIVLKRHLEEH